ncbi:alpha/beta-hydrolase [Plenodomus tracheiphilus IPT5]|uniref:Alpha/beta-hydrolase n=1 Tax=Plenodomus tracheiphilus IPT5 TaxID=1408161 RepID=A0A6A7BCN6_9PLEO|nr:alpha/beta-hydrolase [Plenodomus tracheiphilus IPT5]
MATPQQNFEDDREAVTPYTMHVSSRYLSLTHRKLELTRLPRELDLPTPDRWSQGTPKSVLEPLLDFWLEGYEWRKEEEEFNRLLPQFRTSVGIRIPSAPLSVGAKGRGRTGGKKGKGETDLGVGLERKDEMETLRIHFVHKRSSRANAIPLLFCHTWPSSFVEVQRVIEALTEPVGLPGGEGVQAFHVVAPSIPGFGFSDASLREDFGLRATAGVFDAVMGRLGYAEGGYVAVGTGWGFSICRALALDYPTHCLAVHTSNPSFPAPSLKKSKLRYVRYRIAKLTKAKIPMLSFGYTPTELYTPPNTRGPGDINDALQLHRPLGPTLHHLYSLRPQTLAFSLCDSPVGLLAALLDVIHTREVVQDPLASRSISPFLSPVELEMQEARVAQTSVNASAIQTSTYGLESVEEEAEVQSDTTERPVGVTGEWTDGNGGEVKGYTWSPTEILNFVMLQWLPGPEANSEAGTATPLMWGSASWDIAWVKRHQQPATLPGFEAPDLLVMDMREYFGMLMKNGRLGRIRKGSEPAENGQAQSSNV